MSPDGSHAMNFLNTILIFCSYTLVILTMPFSLILCVKIVPEYERAVIFRMGKICKGGSKGPGMFFLLPCIDAYFAIDMRTKAFDVPPQELLTKDAVTVRVDAVVYFRIADPVLSVVNVRNAYQSSQLLAQTFLRNVLGTKLMSELLSDREQINRTLLKGLEEATEPWGVKIERVEITDVRIPIQMQRAMAAEAEATRDAKAKVISAQGELIASKSLKEAADVMFTSPASIHLRYLQTLVTISADKNSTVIFPFPTEILYALARK